MSVIDIEVGMQHLRAEADDQPLVQRYLDAAEDSAMQYLQRRFLRAPLHWSRPCWRAAPDATLC